MTAKGLLWYYVISIIYMLATLVYYYTGGY